MFGPPKDIEGECNARMIMGDDYGDNSCTCRCTLPKGHEGRHQELSRQGEDRGACKVEITWEGDDMGL